MMTLLLSRTFTCTRDDVNIGVVQVQEEMSCNEMRTVKEFMDLSNMVSDSRECEVTLFVITRLMECGELLYGKSFLLNKKGTVYKKCVGVPILN